MAKLIIFVKYYFFIWAGENPNERKHIHIFRTNSKNVKGAKVWLDDLSIFERGDFTEKELNQIKKDLDKYYELTVSQVEKVLNGEKTKAILIKK